MTDTTTPIVKLTRAQQIEAYKEKLWRTSIAVRKELKEDVGRAVELSGANSLSDLITRIALAPEALGAALKPVISTLEAPWREKTATMRTALEVAKGSGLSAEEIQQLLADAAARKKAGQV